MFKSSVKAVVLSFCVATMTAGASATADQTPKATDLLFETKHIVMIAPGTVLKYNYERTPTNEQYFGKAVKDEIKVTIEKDSAAAGKKDVVVNMFTGDNARDPNKITEMDGNPMLIVFLDTALGRFNQIVGGDRAYLKHKFSQSFLSDAKVEPVKVTYKGEDVDGYRVSVIPYANDASRAKMKGFETSLFTITISEKVPGQFAQMTSNYVNTDKTFPTLTETMTLDGVGGVK